MATKYAVGELHPNTSPQRISELLNRASGDGWELVAVFGPHNSRGMVQYYLRGSGRGDSETVEAMFAEASRDAS